MSKIRSKNTEVENIIFRELRRREIYFQKHYKKAIGRPDVAMPSKKIAIFIDGDFWHGYQFSKKKLRLPKKYWQGKIKNNINRDKRSRGKLEGEGWKVLRVWEHEIEKDLDKAVEKIIRFLS